MDSNCESAPEGQESTDDKRTDDGNERRENVDFEALAREYAALQTEAFWREETDDRARRLFAKLRNGERIEYDELYVLRRRLQEFDEAISEFLFRAGDLDSEQARDHGVYVEPDRSEYLANHEPLGGDDGDE